MLGPSEAQLNWAAHRNKIEDLYWNHAKELPEVMETMKRMYGFEATKKMYKNHFKAWGLQKNLNKDESIAMLKIKEQRWVVHKKKTEFIRRGKRVDPGKLRRFAKRHKLVADGGVSSLRDTEVTTPPYITYMTPEPDDPWDNSVPAASQPYPDPETSERGPVSPVPRGVDGDGSPPTRNIHWDLMSWPSDDACSDSQQPTHTVMAAPSISDAFSHNPMPETSQDASRINMNSPFSPSTWSAPAYQVPADGTPSWAFDWHQAQHTTTPVNCGSDPEPAGFSGHYGAVIGHGLPGISTFGNANPAHGLDRSSNTRLGSLDHSDLHNAVIYSDLDSVNTLLQGGSNPNCAARGGMTPLHYAAYQRNVEVVKLLLEHGASLDAVTDKGRSVLFFALRGRYHPDNSDMTAFAGQSRAGSAASPTDEDTVRIIEALFNAPTRWARLLRSLEKADGNGVTPLMIAAGEGFHKTATILLKRGARPDVRDHANHTALKYAARNGHRDLVRLLLLADPVVSVDHDLSHILKLASKNFTARATAAHGQEQGGQADSWDSWSASVLIAEEMASWCEEMGVLDDLLRLAKQRCKTNVLELLIRATRRLRVERQGSVDGVP